MNRPLTDRGTQLRRCYAARTAQRAVPTHGKCAEAKTPATNLDGTVQGPLEANKNGQSTSRIGTSAIGRRRGRAFATARGPRASRAWEGLRFENSGKPLMIQPVA